MSLSEVELAYFLPLLLVVYWLLPRRAAVQNAAIVVASLFFYATWSLKLLPLFVVSTAVGLVTASAMSLRLYSSPTRAS